MPITSEELVPQIDSCRRIPARLRLLLIWGAMALWAAGCARVPVAQQSHVAKPNMLFAETVVFGDRSALQGQIEPGAAATGGAQAAGCTSCK